MDHFQPLSYKYRMNFTITPIYLYTQRVEISKYPQMESQKECLGFLYKLYN
jgi:hypothetical protein